MDHQFAINLETAVQVADPLIRCRAERLVDVAEDALGFLDADPPPQLMDDRFKPS